LQKRSFGLLNPAILIGIHSCIAEKFNLWKNSDFRFLKIPKLIDDFNRHFAGSLASKDPGIEM
jgi:hypothetical protein